MILSGSGVDLTKLRGVAVGALRDFVTSFASAMESAALEQLPEVGFGQDIREELESFSPPGQMLVSADFTGICNGFFAIAAAPDTVRDAYGHGTTWQPDDMIEAAMTESINTAAHSTLATSFPSGDIAWTVLAPRAFYGQLSYPRLWHVMREIRIGSATIHAAIALDTMRTELSRIAEQMIFREAQLREALQKHEENERDLIRLATTDSLTGIANRRHFNDRADRLFRNREGAPLCAGLIDADHFKKINDSHGHDVGDVVLQELVRRGASILPDGAVFGRLGGEEFGLALPGLSVHEATDVGERFRHAIEAELFDVGQGLQLPVTISVGMAESRPGDQYFGDILRRADQALYSSKSRGRNRVLAA